MAPAVRLGRALRPKEARVGEITDVKLGFVTHYEGKTYRVRGAGEWREFSAVDPDNPH